MWLQILCGAKSEVACASLHCFLLTLYCSSLYQPDCVQKPTLCVHGYIFLQTTRLCLGEGEFSLLEVSFPSKIKLFLCCVVFSLTPVVVLFYSNFYFLLRSDRSGLYNDSSIVVYDSPLQILILENILLPMCLLNILILVAYYKYFHVATSSLACNNAVTLTDASFPCAVIPLLQYGLTVRMIELSVITHIAVKIISLLAVLAAFCFTLLAICPSYGWIQALLSRW